MRSFCGSSATSERGRGIPHTARDEFDSQGRLIVADGHNHRKSASRPLIDRDHAEFAVSRGRELPFVRADERQGCRKGFLDDYGRRDMDRIQRPNVFGLNQFFRFAQELRNEFDQLPVRTVVCDPRNDRIIICLSDFTLSMPASHSRL